MPKDSVKHRENVKRWYEKNREDILARRRAKRAADPQPHRDRHAEWYAKNRDRVIAYAREYHEKNRDKKAAHNAEWIRTHPIHTLLGAARARARSIGLPYDLTTADIVIPDVCPVLGIPLFKGEGKQCANSPSIDRIVPALGYVRGNVWVISLRANTLKSDATTDELERLVAGLRRCLG